MRYRLFGLFCLAAFLSLGLLVACGGAAPPAPTTPPLTATPLPPTPTPLLPTPTSPPPTPTPVPPTPTPPPEEEAPYLGHSLAGREGACLACHETGVGGAPQFPADHAGRTDDTCLDCHEAPPLITHSLEGRAECLVCHETGVGEAPQVPADHAGRTNDLCQNCHVTE